MRIRFWGVRGSIPSPLLPSQISSKISAIMERLGPSDLKNPESRERFLANLPPWLLSTVGGNTPCVTVQLKNKKPAVQKDSSQPKRKPAQNELLVFDAGSGMRELGMAAGKQQSKPSQYHVFFSHFHGDHTMGLPFFGPVYDPSVKMDFYSPEKNFEAILQGEITPPYFPIRMESMASKKAFHTLSGPLELSGASVSYRLVNHPGGCYSYKVDDGKHKFIYATDSELSPEDFQKNDENTSYFSRADLIVIDTQYTLGEAIEKYNWGHNAFSLAVDFAAFWNIKHMVLFHHDPAYDDQKLFSILQSAKSYVERLNVKKLKLSLAVEGMEISL